MSPPPGFSFVDWKEIPLASSAIFRYFVNGFIDRKEILLASSAIFDTFVNRSNWNKENLIQDRRAEKLFVERTILSMPSALSHIGPLSALVNMSPS